MCPKFDIVDEWNTAMNAETAKINHVVLTCITGNEKKVMRALQKSYSEKFQQIHKK